MQAFAQCFGGLQIRAAIEDQAISFHFDLGEFFVGQIEHFPKDGRQISRAFPHAQGAFVDGCQAFLKAPMAFLRDAWLTRSFFSTSRRAIWDGNRLNKVAVIGRRARCAAIVPGGTSFFSIFVGMSPLA